MNEPTVTIPLSLATGIYQYLLERPAGEVLEALNMLAPAINAAQQDTEPKHQTKETD